MKILEQSPNLSQHLSLPWQPVDWSRGLVVHAKDGLFLEGTALTTPKMESAVTSSNVVDGRPSPT